MGGSVCNMARSLRDTAQRARGMRSISRYNFCIAKGGAAFVLRHGISARDTTLRHDARAQRHSTTGAATRHAA